MWAIKPDPYIDDINHTKGDTFEKHLDILSEILLSLLEEGMQVNLVKSALCAKQFEFLGFLLTQKGYQPTQKRIKAILKIKRLQNLEQTHMLLAL